MSHAVTDDARDANVFMSGVPLEQFLPLVEMDRKTCSVKVRSADREGVLHFRDGALLDARAGDLGGLDAAYEILSWEDDPEIALQAEPPDVEQVIHDSIQFLLLESCRFRDEGARERPQVEPAAPEPEAPEPEAPEPEAPRPVEADSPVVPFPGASTPPAADFDRDVMLPCLRIIDDTSGVGSVVFVMRDGTVLGERNAGEQIGTLLAYLAMEAQRIRQTLGVAGPNWITMNCTSGNRIVAVLGAQVVLGLVADASVSPQKLVAKLHPVICSAVAN